MAPSSKEKTVTELEARQALKAIHAQASKVTKQIADLETAIERAERIVNDAEKEVRSFAGLDKQISNERVRIVKGGGDPKKLPEVLKARIAAKREAEEEKEQAVTTLELLQNELEELKARWTVRMPPMPTGNFEKKVEAPLIFEGELKKGALQVLRAIADARTAKIVELRKILTAAIEASAYIQTDRWGNALEALLADPDAEVIVPREITAAENAIRALKG
jgi:hypothetical protein